jgi:signal transduction histidine kinase
MRLRTKLLAAMLLAAVPPVAVSGWFATTLHQEGLRASIDELHRRAAVDAAGYVEGFVRGAVSDLRHSLAYVALDRFEGDALVQALRLLYLVSPRTSTIVLLGEDGKKLAEPVFADDPDAAAETRGHEAMDEAALAWFAAHIPLAEALSAGAAVGVPYAGPPGPARVAIAAVYSVPAVAPASAPASAPAPAAAAPRRWVVAAEISLREVESRLAAAAVVGVHGVASLRAGADRHVVAATAPDPPGALVSGSAEVPSLGWTVTVAQPAADAYAAAERLRLAALFWIAVALLLAAGLGLWLGGGLSRPVAALAGAARAIAGGNLDQRIDAPPAGGDEVDELARAFNHMSFEVAQRDAQLRTWARELENRVAEKTHELSQAQDEILRARKYAAVAQLGAGVAHEVNNPLTSVLGLTQLLLMDKPADSPERRTLQDIETEAMRIREIVSALSKMTEAEAAPREVVALGDVVDRALELAQDELRAHDIEVVREANGELPTFTGNRDRLVSAVHHLVRNAVTAMRGRPKATLRLRLEHIDRKLVKLVVADEGTGIAPEHLDRIFDPFFTTKGEWRGRGLGLSEVYATVAEHRGKVDVKSELGKGTVVTIVLPAVRGEGMLA